MASADLETQRIHLQPDQIDDPPAPFRTGEAGQVWLDEGGRIRTDRRVLLSANSTHALVGHGVVGALNALAVEGELGCGADVLIPHAILDDAQLLFYEADRKTYGGSWEFVVDRVPPGIEYCVCVDNREYQRTLSRLTFLLGSASRAGRAVRMRI